MTVDKWKQLFRDPSVATLPADNKRWHEVTRSFKQQRNAADIAWADYSFNVSPVDSSCSAGTNDLANITAPMYVIHGQHDTVVDATQVASWAGEIVTLAVPLLKAGHLPMLECLDDFVLALVNFLQSTGAEITTPLPPRSSVLTTSNISHPVKR
jgi:pimeloyl-ACP methyl ester carboxylesterase